MEENKKKSTKQEKSKENKELENKKKTNTTKTSKSSTNKDLKKSTSKTSKKKENKNVEKKKDEKKEHKKLDRRLKITLSLLVIILMSAISFGGIYVQYKNNMENLIPDYTIGTDLEGYRRLGLVVDESTNTVIYDKDGNVVDEEGDETTTVEEPINPEDVRTPENYKEVKEIIEKRLKFMGVNDYTIGLNEGNGSIVLDMTDNSRTDTIAEYMYMQGRFQITDADTDEVLIDYTQITDVNYAYTSYGTGVYIIIEFNDEGKQKLNEISTTYVQSTDADGNDTTKNVQISVDDEVLTESYFSQENTTGRLELNIGSTPTTTADLENNIMQAAGITSVLKYGLLPVSYNLDENRYISSEIPHEIIYLAAIVVGVITIITLIVMIIKYRRNGLLAAISVVGYIASLLLILRYAYVYITLDGLLAIVVSMIVNFVFIFYLLQTMKKGYEDKEKIELEIDFKNVLISMLFIMIPLMIISVILCFTEWLQLFSFGMVIVWGIIILLIYNIVITRTMLVNSSKE